MAVFGHSGSHAPQLMHSSVILMAMASFFYNFTQKYSSVSYPTKTRMVTNGSGMMTNNERIEGFVKLGERIQSITPTELSSLTANVQNENAWFTPESVSLALKGITQLIQEPSLSQWANRYNLNTSSPRKIGVVMAGNIPLVGFHDLLSVVIAGHQLVAKLSSQDSVLMKFVREELIRIDARFADFILFEERLNKVDALIATGSDNTARYFEYYFRNVPHIIRKNRSSCAAVMGEESSEEFVDLGKDIFSYFGLGCRNVSKIFLPEGYDFIPMLKSWEPFQPIANHHKYANNYDYQKSILLINQNHFYDTGFLLVTENQNLVSPISTVYYEFYSDQQDLQDKIKSNLPKLQCVVSANGWFDGSVPFGEAQFPKVDDYADGVDTLAFLTA
jgi:hypothetical protein